MELVGHACFVEQAGSEGPGTRVGALTAFFLLLYRPARRMRVMAMQRRGSFRPEVFGGEGSMHLVCVHSSQCVWGVISCMARL